MGERRATELALTGRTFTAADALAYGLVHEIAASPLQRAEEIATQISKFSEVAVTTGLDYLNRTRDKDWDETGRIGSEIRRAALASPQFQEAVRAFLK